MTTSGGSSKKKNAGGNKKKTIAKPDRAVMKQRREAIETRICKMQAKIDRDRALLLKCTAVDDEDDGVSQPPVALQAPTDEEDRLTVPIDEEEEEEDSGNKNTIV